MAVVILYAPAAELEAEALARACERRGVFIELETGMRVGRPWRPEDVCVALLTPGWEEHPGGDYRLRRAFDAAVDARLAPTPLEGALTPFGWRDLPVGAPPWPSFAESLLHPGPAAQPAPAAGPPAKVQRRQVILLSTRAAAAEAADLARALKRHGHGVDFAGPDASGARMRAALDTIDAAVLLLNSEAGQSDGMRRWLHLLTRERMPLLCASVDSLWRDAPLSVHLGNAKRIDLGRLPGAVRGERLARAVAGLPKKSKRRRRV